MKLKKTLILALVLLVVGAYIQFIELPKERQENQNELFLRGAKEEAIRSIAVEGKKGGFRLTNQSPEEPEKVEGVVKKESVEGTSKQSTWMLDGVPSNTKLDPGAVRSLVAALTDFRLGEAIPPEEIGSDLSVFGLDKPEVTISLGLSGKEENVAFGKRSTFVGKRYVKVSDRGVFTVDDGLFSSADKDRDSFRLKSPIAADLAEFSSIDIVSGDGPVRIEKNIDGVWNIVKPFAAKADSQVIADYVRQLRSLRAVTFIDPPDSEQLDKFNLATPDVAVVLEGKTRKLETRIGVTVKGDSSEGEKSETAMYFWFNESPSVYKIDGNRVNLFRLPAQSFQDKHVFESDPEKLTGVEVKREGLASWNLKKEAGVWKLNGSEINSGALRSYLDTLARFEIEKYALPSDTQEPFGKPEARLILQEGEGEIAWEIGAQSPLQPGELHPVRKKDGSVVGFITGKGLAELVPDEKIFLKK